MSGWRTSLNPRGSGAVEPRNPTVNVNSRSDFVPLAPSTFHPVGTNPVQTSNNDSPAKIPPPTEVSNVNHPRFYIIFLKNFLHKVRNNKCLI